MNDAGIIKCHLALSMFQMPCRWLQKVSVQFGVKIHHNSSLKHELGEACRTAGGTGARPCTMLPATNLGTTPNSADSVTSWIVGNPLIGS